MRIARRISSAFGVRPGEGARVAALIGHSLFNGIFAAFFLTAANALFLDRFEISYLPPAYIAAAAVGYLAVMLFSRLEKVVGVGPLLVTNLAVLTLLSGAFWVLAQTTGSKWALFAMFVFVGPMFSLVALGYWGLAGRLFDLRQGKRLFGLVGAGEEVSTIVGLFSIPFIIKALAGPLPLLLIATAGLAGSLLVVLFITRAFGETIAAGGDEAAPGPKQEGAGLGGLIRVRYFLLLAGSVVLLNFAHYGVDFGFLAQTRAKFEGPEQLARFIGIFYGATKVVELVMKVAVSGRLLSQFGLKVGLLVLPVLLALCAAFGIVIGGLGLGAAHFFVVVALAKLVAVVARSSAFEPSFRVLYQPVEARDRLSYQSHVEGTAKQLAVGVVGVALLLFSRGQSFDALKLFYGLVPILGAWMVVNVLVHREYRTRLVDGLKARAGKRESAGPLEALAPALRSERPGDAATGLDLVERIAPGRLDEVVRSMLADPRPAVRVPALEAVERNGLLDLSPEVDALATDEDPGVGLAARRCAGRLAELEALVADDARAEELARSPRAEDRSLAAMAVGRGAVADADRLSVLLWDREPSVRLAALAAAGRLGTAELRPLLVGQLAVPAYASVAASALVRIGGPAVGEIARAFGRDDVDPAMRHRSLAICEAIGGAEASSLLVGKLGFPDRNVRRRALASLVRLAHRVTPVEVPMVERAVEDVVRATAWDMAVALDLGRDQALTEVREALEAEIEESRAWLLDLLSLLYDPGAIAVVKESLASGSSRSTVYALEILDLLLAPGLKPLVFPMLEDQTYGQTLKRLEAFVPRQRMSPQDALGAIANREFDRIGLWTRVVAIETLGKVAPGVARDLVASLFHPEPMVQEVAALGIVARNRAAWETHRTRLGFEVRDRLDAVVGRPGEEDLSGSRSVFGRTRLLRTVPAFSKLPAETLVALAESSEERILKEGQRLPNPREPRDSFYILLNGELTVVGSPSSRFENLTFFGTLPGALPVEGRTPCRLVRLEPTRLFELSAENPALIPGLLEASRLLARNASSA
jgi:ATP:ADP antiporter, AAA family